MKFHKQRIWHDPDNGQWGDCYRTAVACVLDLEPEEVPHFFDKGGTGGQARMEKWLLERGIAMIGIPVDAGASFKDVLNATDWWFPGLPVIVLGKTESDVGHVLIAQDGKVLHDTTLREDGGSLRHPCDDGNWWLQVLVWKDIVGAMKGAES